jgi:hypothetical protein
MVIEKGIIHNPHFYEFQRQAALGGRQTANRNNADIPCGGVPDIAELVRFFHPERATFTQRHLFGWNRPRPAPESEENMVMDIHRCYVHVVNYDLIDYQYHAPDNMDLRVKYLLGEMDEDEWKHTLQIREKAIDKKRDITNILTMFRDTCGDLLRQMVLKELEVSQFIRISTELANYFNNTMTSIHKRYNCVTPWIDVGRWTYNCRRKTYKGDDR